MIKEFKAFMLKGNILDLAIGFIMGAAFVGIVGALTTDIINPFIGMIVGKPAFDTTITIGKGTFLIGAFITSLINFALIALTAFFIMKTANAVTTRGRKKEEVVEDKPEEVIVLTEIRDLLARR